MSEPRSAPEIWTDAVARLIVRLTLYVAVLWGLWYVLGRLKSLITTLFLAMILAYIIRPLAGWLIARPTFRKVHNALARPFFALVPQRLRPSHGIPIRALRVVAALYVMVLLFVGIWYSGRYLISPFTIEIRNVQENWDDYRRTLQEYRQQVIRWYTQQIKPEYREWLEDQFRGVARDGAMRSHATTWLGRGIRRSSTYVLYIVELVLMPVLAFYFAVESRQLKHDLVGLLPRKRRRATLRLIADFNDIMYSFVICQAVLCLIAGIVVGVGLAALGVPYPVSLGVLAGLTRAIPIIGPIIGGIPIVLLALVTKGFGVAVGVLIFFSILNFVESKFIMPLLIGDSLSLHPVIIIVVLLIGEEFAGLLGMFFAAPVAALLRVVLQRYWLPHAQEGVGSGTPTV